MQCMYECGQNNTDKCSPIAETCLA